MIHKQNYEKDLPIIFKSVMIDNADKMFTENCMRTIVEPQLWCICRWDISVQQYEALWAVRATYG